MEGVFLWNGWVSRRFSGLSSGEAPLCAALILAARGFPPPSAFRSLEPPKGGTPNGAGDSDRAGGDASGVGKF